MRRDRQGRERHISHLCLGSLRRDARRLNVVDDVVQELAEERELGARRVGVDLDVCVFCGCGVVVGFRGEGEDGFLKGFYIYIIRVRSGKCGSGSLWCRRAAYARR
jgi:hypothetical protein